jgi:adenosylcobinamide-GDP ribazoletransferase
VSPIRAFSAAIAFLTRLPVGRFVELDAADVGRAAPLFPLVGAAIGAGVGGVAVLLHGPVPAWPAAAVAVAVGTVLTGALHLDALADTADAVGARSREHALEIMRDHAVGSFGAAALVLDLVTKVGAVAALLARPHATVLVLAAVACARAAPLPLAALLPYARPGGGAGAALTETATPIRAAVGVALAAGVAVGAAGLDGAYVLAAAGAVTLALGAWYTRWLGGVTGDTLGAASEVAETAALVVAAAVA